MVTVRLQQTFVRAEGAILSALLYSPTGASREPFIVLAHGFTGSKESMDPIANYLATKGWRCLTFDFRGHKLGGSTGEMHAAENGRDDLRAVLRHAQEELGAARTVIAGHSFGGAMALGVAAEDPRTCGVAVLGTSASVVSGFESPAGAALMAQRGDYVRGAPPVQILTEATALAEKALPGLAIPVLLVAARGDIIVKPDAVKALAHRLHPLARFVLVDGSHMELPMRARGFLASWLEEITDTVR